MSSLIVGGILIALMGYLNLSNARRRPDVPNAPTIAKLGWVGILIGSLLVAIALVQLVVQSVRSQP